SGPPSPPRKGATAGVRAATRGWLALGAVPPPLRFESIGHISIEFSLFLPRVIVSCSGLACGPERRRGDGEAIEEDDRSEAASGAVRSAGGALGGGGGTTQRRVGTVGS